MNAYQFYSEGVKEWHLETLWAAVKLPLTQFAVILKGQAAVSPLGNFCRAHILQVNLISVCNQGGSWAIEHGDCPSCPFHLACEAELVLAVLGNNDLI